ncbi:MmcQ/YjbR family DNA-binding protein [Actinomycetospora sp. TBRC 11914]|uniref:MmcQ/YjbR family DNA-binding protein n=1 Tax=Actinomycetospora sp. TBRC 11914 TaxID=2729387 RepID=UPI00289D5315|nr:MmcQ/YjbR family DNA-binding protein [Actinomycetospora sp. TBRC 11914]
MSTERTPEVGDVHGLARAMPHVKALVGPKGNAIYQVGGKSFVFFRTPQRDAADPDTGAKYDDVVMFWVEDEEAKAALVGDPTTPFFTTPRFDGHPSVLLRTSRLGELDLAELREIVQDAWLAQASPRRRDAWLAEHAP